MAPRGISKRRPKRQKTESQMSFEHFRDSRYLCRLWLRGLPYDPRDYSPDPGMPAHDNFDSIDVPIMCTVKRCKGGVILPHLHPEHTHDRPGQNSDQNGSSQLDTDGESRTIEEGLELGIDGHTICPDIKHDDNNDNDDDDVGYFDLSPTIEAEDVDSYVHIETPSNGTYEIDPENRRLEGALCPRCSGRGRL